MTPSELELLADEEMERALTLSWRALSTLVPWGDTYTGVSPSGQAVELERHYVWDTGEGGDIRVEVRAYLDQARYDQGAARVRKINKS